MHDRILHSIENLQMSNSQATNEGESPAVGVLGTKKRVLKTLMDDRILWLAFFGAFVASVSAQMYHFLWHQTLPPFVWGAAFGGGALGGAIGYFRRRAHTLRNDRERRIKQLIEALGQAARK